MSTLPRSRRLSRAESKDATRQRLLDAARRVFLRQGFHATTVDMVAEEAGFTKGAVYSTFASKADMFLALYELRSEERAARIGGVVEAASSPVAEIARLWAEVLRTEREWLLVLLEFWIHVARHERLRRRFAEVNARLRASFAGQMERAAQRTGRPLPVDADLLVTCQMGLGNGLALESFRDPSLASGEAYQVASAALMRGFEAQREEQPVRRRAAT